MSAPIPPSHGAQAQAGATTHSHPRFHALDAVRASALLLGVVFHAAESFESNAVTYWAVADPSSSRLLEIFRHASHSFRMELFFLIAGFFAHLVWQRRGVSGFVRNRVQRILVPLLVGWCLLYPILVFLWSTGAAMQGRWEVLGVPPEARSLPPWQLTLGFFLTLQFVRKFDLTHLWFLHQLLVLYGIALAVRAAVDRRPGGHRVVAGLDRGFRRLVDSRFLVVGFAALVWPSLWLQGGWGVATPKESLVPDPAITWLYGICFGFGWALHRQPDLLPVLARPWRGHLATAGVLVAATSVGFHGLREAGWVSGTEPWVRPAYLVLYAWMMGSFVCGLLGLFLERCHGESPTWRYLADSSYWVYLAHLPLVVGLQILVAPWTVPWWIKFPVINLVAFPLLYLSYHVLVRSTVLGERLNGRRYPFVLPGRRQARP